MIVDLLGDVDRAFKNRSRGTALYLFKVYGLLFELDIPFVKKGKEHDAMHKIIALNKDGLQKLQVEFVDSEINHICKEAYKAYLES